MVYEKIKEGAIDLSKVSVCIARWVYVDSVALAVGSPVNLSTVVSLAV
jgi:hypothetical protein